MEETIQQTLSRLTRLLNSQGIRHALVGGLAASIRGRVRVTEDVDLVLDCNIEEAIAVLNGLDPACFVPFVADAEAIVRQCYILPLEDSRSKVKADLAIGMSGFEKLIVQRATVIEIGRVPVPVATAEDLLVMKVMAGRPQDDQDIKGLLAANGSKLDWNYCIDVSTQLQEAIGMDLLSRVLKLKVSQP